jgi:1-acyl-sn-glycerol-3-phosphate acyltransferase
VSDRFSARWEKAAQWLRRYHRYEVVTETDMPKGGVLVVGTHSLATYEGFLLNSAVQEATGRRALILVDDLWFKIPLLADNFRAIGFVPGDRRRAIELLREGEVVGVGPGGLREAMRPSRQRYLFDWSDRRGFIWTSLLAGAPIILTACPGADDIYTVYKTRLTPWVYRRFHFPFPVFRGRGPTLLPRPVKLVHFIDTPIPPPVPPDKVTEDDVKKHHAYVVERMHALMLRAVQVTEERRRAEQ